MGPLNSLFCPEGRFLYTMIVPGGGILPFSSRAPGGGVVLEKLTAALLANCRSFFPVNMSSMKNEAVW